MDSVEASAVAREPVNDLVGEAAPSKDPAT